jgi:SAM-dependent methyltransferase
MQPVTPARFPAARLFRLAEIERWHFWFVARRHLVDGLLKIACPRGVGRLLDVGCGTGTNATMLRAHGRRVVCVDYRPEGLNAAARGQRGDAVFVQASATHLPFVDGAYDAVTALDVLEHVDDKAALEEIRRVLRPGGSLLITVPAMPCLWSVRDDEAGHLRRYRRRMLIGMVSSCRLELQRVTYYQCFLFPLVLVRVLRRKSAAARDYEEQPRPLLNRVLCWINRVEVGLTRFISWPFGSSLVAVCRRPEP